MGKRIAIVGGGPCGLVALKEMLAAGHDATLFERSSRYGGHLASDAVYPNLYLTISNWAMGFSDFPDIQRLCYPSAQQYQAYLREYTRHFKLESHIKYRSEVCSASFGLDGTWTIVVQHWDEKRNRIGHFDACIVATGSNQVPNALPNGLIGFSGRVIHSTQLSDEFRQQVADKQLRILVVGAGESGADVSAELGDRSKNVTTWLRHPACVGPRYLNSASEMEQVKANQDQDFPANGFLEAATTNRMSTSQNVYVYGLFRRLLWHTSVLNRTLNRMCLDSTATAFFMNDQATYVTKNQRMCEALHNNKIDVIVAPEVSASRQTVKFFMPDGSTNDREFDTVVLCTGFHAEFPWLNIPGFNSNPRSWFLRCFPKDLGHCLFFVGYARPHQGGIPAMAEILSRYIALVLRGDRSLPCDYAAQAQRDGSELREYYYMSPDLHTLVDYNAFLESVARRIGCEPRLPLSCILLFNVHMLTVLVIVAGQVQSKLNPIGLQCASLLWATTVTGFFLYDDGIILKWWFYPNWSVWYRQRGPGASPMLLKSVLRRVPLWRATKITNGFVLLVLWSIPTFYVQRVISALLLVSDTVFKSLGFSLFSKGWVRLLCPKLFALHGVEWRLSDIFLP